MYFRKLLIYIKQGLKWTSPLLFLIFYWVFTHNDIEMGKKELYNNIPAINVYNSELSLRDSLVIDGRAPTVIMGMGSFLINDNGRTIKNYYQSKLEKLGWYEDGYKVLKDRNGIHYADRFFFTKGEYTFVIMITPPLKEYDNHNINEVYLKIHRPRYNITIGKQNAIE